MRQFWLLMESLWNIKRIFFLWSRPKALTRLNLEYFVNSMTNNVRWPSYLIYIDSSFRCHMRSQIKAVFGFWWGFMGSVFHSFDAMIPNAKWIFIIITTHWNFSFIRRFDQVRLKTSFSICPEFSTYTETRMCSYRYWNAGVSYIIIGWKFLMIWK